MKSKIISRILALAAKPEDRNQNQPKWESL